MDTASVSTVDTFRPQLLDRRVRLLAASDAVPAAYFNELIAEIDAALGRIDNGSYGRCETCLDPIEADRLAQNPLVRFCLDHLSQAELEAHQQDLDLAAQIQSKLCHCVTLPWKTGTHSIGTSPSVLWVATIANSSFWAMANRSSLPSVTLPGKGWLPRC